MLSGLSDREMNGMAFKTCFMDTWNSLTWLKSVQHQEGVAIVQYVFSSTDNYFFVLAGTAAGIESGKLLIDRNTQLKYDMFRSCYEQYKKCFLAIDNLVSPETFYELKATWLLFYELFMAVPLEQCRAKRVYMSFKCDYGDENPVIDFNNLYNLRYRFNEYQQNDNLNVTTVTTGTMLDFLKRMHGLCYPVPGNAVMLYGLRRDHQLIMQNPYSTEEEKQASSRRESIFERIFTAVRQQGGEVMELEDINSLKTVFSAGYRDKFIQLVSHFHDNRLYTALQQSLGSKVILSTVKNMISNKELRDDIIIDAATCKNFDFFRQLYELNVKYIYMSHHNLSTDILANMLLELYTGQQAGKLNWPYPYLDGKTYLHEAWSNVSRCFYTASRKGTIEI